MQLDPMTQAEYDAYIATSVDNYIRDTARAWARPPEEVEERARKDFAELLPDGLASPNQHLFTARLQAGGPAVGLAWVGMSERPSGRAAYIYDIFVNAESRGQGVGRRLLQAVEAKAIELGATRIGLNVFGYNTAARSLYESAGFRVGGMGMFKMLERP
ncbi:GNAT family N-acetyltransferase [Ramlibacter sp. PS4R-6]|uniref:GNAT family N-acetyltransferase n=1 Tax=Ramlibacter sp. PS4R-6 TaxID=3133438 RepID=UPI00309C3041